MSDNPKNCPYCQEKAEILKVETVKDDEDDMLIYILYTCHCDGCGASYVVSHVFQE